MSCRGPRSIRPPPTLAGVRRSRQLNIPTGATVQRVLTGAADKAIIILAPIQLVSVLLAEELVIAALRSVPEACGFAWRTKWSCGSTRRPTGSPGVTKPTQRAVVAFPWLRSTFSGSLTTHPAPCGGSKSGRTGNSIDRCAVRRCGAARSAAFDHLSQNRQWGLSGRGARTFGVCVRLNLRSPPSDGGLLRIILPGQDGFVPCFADSCAGICAGALPEFPARGGGGI